AKGAHLMVVDMNAEALRKVRERNCTVLFGDVNDPEFASTLPLNEADAVICTAQETSTNLYLLQTLEKYGYQGAISLTAMDDATAQMFQKNRNVTVIRPLKMAANSIIDSLPDLRDRSRKDT
ncbi:MAG TPA: NAD-binding protein, partial [Microbacteriaceae bacterium]